MKQAYGYLRVSGKGQVEGDGFDRQKDEILIYAEKYDVEIVKFYQEEGVTGEADETNRPAFQEMINEILDNGINTIIIEGLDRLARKNQIQEHFLAFLALKNINLISARTEINVVEDFASDPMKKAMIQIQGVFAELEKNLLVKKLKAARDRKRKETGKCEGRKNIEETEEGRELIKIVKRLRRKPRNGNKLSFQKIAVKMNTDGIKTFTGKNWTGFSVQKVLQRH